MDLIRSELADFKHAEELLIEQRKRSADATANLTLWINGIGALLIIGFALLILPNHTADAGE